MCYSVRLLDVSNRTLLGTLFLRFHIGDNLILDVPRNFAADYQNTTHFSLVRKLSEDEELQLKTRSFRLEDEKDGKDQGVQEAQYRDMAVSGGLLVSWMVARGHIR